LARSTELHQAAVAPAIPRGRPTRREIFRRAVTAKRLYVPAEHAGCVLPLLHPPQCKTPVRQLLGQTRQQTPDEARFQSGQPLRHTSTKLRASPTISTDSLGSRSASYFSRKKWRSIASSQRFRVR